MIKVATIDSLYGGRTWAQVDLACVVTADDEAWLGRVTEIEPAVVLAPYARFGDRQKRMTFEGPVKLFVVLSSTDADKAAASAMQARGRSGLVHVFTEDDGHHLVSRGSLLRKTLNEGKENEG